MSTLFISDLHLDDSRPGLVQLFRDFMRHEAPGADSLYILGDLFEVWVGDDDTNPVFEDIRDEIRRLADSGVPVHIMHGNRDFLLGPDFAAQAGCHLLPEPHVINLHGRQTLLLHGDSLCTDDVEHQRIRAQVRSHTWQQAFLAHPLEQRIARSKKWRAMSEESKRYKPEEIMNVNRGSVDNCLRKHGVYRLIHGHTHRPATHEFTLDGVPACRIVLGDWYDHQGSVLVCDGSGCQLNTYLGSGMSQEASGQ